MASLAAVAVGKKPTVKRGGLRVARKKGTCKPLAPELQIRRAGKTYLFLRIDLSQIFDQAEQPRCLALQQLERAPVVRVRGGLALENLDRFAHRPEDVAEF